MGWVRNLFSSKGVVKDVSEGIINGVDNAFYTDQEEAKDALTRSRIFIELLGAYHPFKQIQRALALTVLPPFVACCVATFTASFWMDVTYQIEILSGLFGYLSLTVGVFYFGGGAVDGVVERVTNRYRNQDK